MDKVTQPGQGQVGAPVQGQPIGQRPAQQQQIDVRELFAMIGELNVQLMVANKAMGELQKENAGLKGQLVQALGKQPTDKKVPGA